MPNRLSRFCEGVMEATWLLGLIITPLFFNIFSSRVFEPDKITTLRSLALVALVAWLWHKQTLDLPAIIGMGLIIAGVLVMNLFSRSIAH